MTGADSPVIADSSTLATPSTTSPSPGITSPASTTTRSPTRSSVPGTCSSPPSAVRRRATVSVRVRAQRCGLGPAASLGDGLGEVGEDDGQPQPERDRPGEDARVDDRQHRGEHATRPRRRTSRGCGPGAAGRACAAASRQRPPASGWASKDRRRAGRRPGSGSTGSWSLVVTGVPPRSGARARAGKKVRPATMRTTTASEPDEHRPVGRQGSGARAARAAARASRPARARTSTIGTNRPKSIARPRAVFWYGVSAPKPANARPVVVRRRGVRVQDLGQPVRAGSWTDASRGPGTAAVSAAADEEQGRHGQDRTGRRA